jgi:hypothetical protein
MQRERESVTWNEDTDDETMIYTPTSSADTSSDEMIVTPTSSTATVTAVATPTASPSFPATFDELNNSSTNSNEASSSEISNDFQGFPEIDADEEDELASITPIFNLPVVEGRRSLFASQEELNWLSWNYESREEREAFEKAMEISRGPQVDYLPINREQHRIMSAYVENMTSKRGFHTKEDDRFFAELLEDQIEPDDDELNGGDDISDD